MGADGGGITGLLYRAGPLVLLLMLLAPHAAAAERAGGSLEVTEKVLFSEITTATASDASALLAPDLTSGIRLSVSSPTGQDSEVCHITVRFVTTESPLPQNSLQVPGPEPECSNEANLTLTATGSAGGASYVGFYPESMRIVLEGAERARAEFWPNYRLRSADATAAAVARDTKGHSQYAVDVEDDSVIVAAAGRVTGTLTGHLKILGVPVHSSSDAGERRYETGQQASPGSVGEKSISWLFVTLKGAEFTLESPDPVIAVVDSLEASTSAEIRFNATTGAVSSRDSIYTPRQNEADSVLGMLTASLSPKHGRVGVLALEGTIISTSMARAPAPSSPLQFVDVDLLWGAGLVAGASLAAVGVVSIRRQQARRAEERARAAELVQWRRYYVHYAEMESDDETPEGAESALVWLYAGLQRFPGDVQMAVMAASLLRLTLRRPREAIRVLCDAADHAPSGEGLADYFAAAAYIEEDEVKDTQQARIHLERALARQPSLRGEIRGDRAFKPLHGLDFDLMLKEAATMWRLRVLPRRLAAAVRLPRR